MVMILERETLWAFDAKMTLYERRCDVSTSHRRSHDVILRHVPAGERESSAKDLSY